MRHGTFDADDAPLLEQTSFDELASDLRDRYSIVFLKRQIGRKHELGLARSVGWEMGLRSSQNSPFPSPYLFWILRNCVLLTRPTKLKDHDARFRLPKSTGTAR